jgi:FtsZ-binding cell division protein ZapB
MNFVFVEVEKNIKTVTLNYPERSSPVVYVNGSLYANSFTGNGINIPNTLNGQNGVVSVGGTVTVNNNNGTNPIFTINGNSYIPGGDSYWINSSGDQGVHLRLHNNGVDSYIDTYPDLIFRTSSNGISMTHCPFYINNTGVGVNTTSVVSAMTVSGTVTCTGLTQTSDERIKTNIQSMTSTLGSLIQLRAVTYNLTSFSISSIAKTTNKNDTIGASGGSKPQGLDSIYINRSHMGFLAQEIQTIYPNLVYTDKNGLMSIDYIGVIPILVESLKEENTTITTLQTTVTNLQNSNTALQTTNTSLQAAITALQASVAALQKKVNAL